MNNIGTSATLFFTAAVFSTLLVFWRFVGAVELWRTKSFLILFSNSPNSKGSWLFMWTIVFAKCTMHIHESKMRLVTMNFQSMLNIIFTLRQLSNVKQYSQVISKSYRAFSKTFYFPLNSSWQDVKCSVLGPSFAMTIQNFYSLLVSMILKCF